MIDLSLDDPDARVQANAIEVLDRLPVPTKHEQLAPKLESSHQRVRANAVAALLKMETGEAAEAVTIARAARLAANAANPRDSVLRGSRDYRKAMVEVLVLRALTEAATKAAA